LMANVTLIGVPLGYLMVIVLFPLALVALLFWYAARQEIVERQLHEITTENDPVK